MWLSLVQVVRVLRIHHEVAMGAIRRYLYSPLPQREAEQVAEFQASKMETTEAAAAARLTVAVRPQRVEQGAKETTAVPLLTLYRRLSVPAAVAQA
jgi:hypothetical protein